MAKIVAEFPAFKMMAYEGQELENGQEFGIAYDSARYGPLYKFYKLGSVAAYAARYNDNVEESVERAKANGHELFYAFGLDVCIHNEPKVQVEKLALNMSDVIGFMGKRFKLVPAANQNVKLVEVF